MIFKDYYKVLGLNTSEVTKEEIKKAYKEMVKKYHPDKNPEGKEVMELIIEAFDVLIDPVKKKKYDKLWITYVSRRKRENITYIKDGRTRNISQELKNIFFGGMFSNKVQKVKEKHENLNIETRLSLNPKEAYQGTEKKIKIKGEELLIKIKPNTKTNDIIVIKCKGTKSEDICKLPGDLIIKIDVKNTEDIKVEGLNIIGNIYLSPAEFITGKEIEYNFFGENLKVIIPKLYNPENKFIVEGKGFKSRYGQGDLILNIKLKIPETISNEQKELYEKIVKLDTNTKK